MTTSNRGSLSGKASDFRKIKAVFQDTGHPAPSAGQKAPIQVCRISATVLTVAARGNRGLQSLKVKGILLSVDYPIGQIKKKT